jgi:sporulation protein YlmC with PRC-barrel domain
MELRAYYAWPPIAAASITPGPVIGSDYTFAALVPPPAVNAEEAEDHDPHLRSLSQELLGCQIETRDGEFGHIEDVTLDLRSGRLISIVIDTSRGRGGYKVVVPVSAITEIRLSGKVRLRAYREDIENAPLFFE